MKSESKSVLQKQLAKKKKALNLLNQQRDDFVRAARTKAWEEFDKKHSKEYSSLNNDLSLLRTQINTLDTKSIETIPEDLRKWVKEFQKGVQMHPFKIIWFSTDRHFLIVCEPGGTTYVDRGSGAKYFSPEYYLLKVVVGARLYGGEFTRGTKPILDHIEGRLTPEKKQQWIDKVKELTNT